MLPGPSLVMSLLYTAGNQAEVTPMQRSLILILALIGMPAMAERLILKTDNLDAVGGAVRRAGGHVDHQTEHFKSLVVELPSSARAALEKRFPDLEVYEDKVLTLVDPVDADSRHNAGASGGPA